MSQEHRAMLARQRGWDRERAEADRHARLEALRSQHEALWRPIFPNLPDRQDTEPTRSTLEPMASPSPAPKRKLSVASFTHELFILLTFLVTVLGGNVAVALSGVLTPLEMSDLHIVSLVAAGILSTFYVNGQFKLKVSEVATGLTWVKAHEALLEKDAEELAGPGSAAKIDGLINEVERIGAIVETVADLQSEHLAAEHAAPAAPSAPVPVPFPSHWVLTPDLSGSGPIAPQVGDVPTQAPVPEAVVADAPLEAPVIEARLVSRTVAVPEAPPTPEEPSADPDVARYSGPR